MAVAIDEVSLAIRGNTILDQVALQLPTGVSGLLGPNGAGKTTLFRVLAGELTPTSGSYRLSSSGTGSALAGVGYLPQRFGLLEHRSVRANIEYAAWVRGVEPDRVALLGQQALERLDLASIAGKRVKTISGGQRQRVGIACAVVHQPSVVLLDEPSVGLDPEQRISLRAMLRSLGTDSTVIVSTHIVEDVTQVADRVIVFDRGRVRFVGAINELEALGNSHPRQSVTAVESGYVQVREEPLPSQAT